MEGGLDPFQIEAHLSLESHSGFPWSLNYLTFKLYGFLYEWFDSIRGQYQVLTFLGCSLQTYLEHIFFCQCFWQLVFLGCAILGHDKRVRLHFGWFMPTSRVMAHSSWYFIRVLGLKGDLSIPQKFTEDFSGLMMAIWILGSILN